MTNRVQSVSTPEEVLAGTSRFAVVCGDATAVLKSLPDNAAHVTYCDPPYGLSSQDTEDVVACLQTWLKGETYTHHGAGFMGKDWDAFVPGPEVWREILRVLNDPRHVAMTRYRLSGEQPVREAPVTPAWESAPAPPAAPLTLDDLFGF